ncbi:DUF2214 domain-containing protein [Mesorhizobium xinjiangense]|uniref:DUF2214 domain-containing protein n=1 Tax=Mesorhizobium xinjiangense TaxID=2678685 RepID=UPI0012EE89CB|nr:DUF2214 domain-containing protein [Mesorhizobium xinjiangense]
MLVEWLQALHEWPVAAFFRRSVYAYPLLNAGHIFALTLLIGAILPADLKVLGFFPRIAAGPFLRSMTAISATGLALAVLTGFLLFSVQPLEYARNPAFLVKLSLIALGTANALVIRFSSAWRDAWTKESISPALRAGALLSLTVWVAALVAGRWIAFV